MKVLVTGAGGFVGRWLVPVLVAAGHEVLGTRLPGEAPPELLPEGPGHRPRWLPLYLEDAASVQGVLEESPEAVIHLAAVVGGIGANRENPGRFFHDNLLMGVSLCSKFGKDVFDFKQ